MKQSVAQHLTFSLQKIKEIIRLCPRLSCLLFCEVFQWLQKKPANGDT